MNEKNTTILEDIEILDKDIENLLEGKELTTAISALTSQLVECICIVGEEVNKEAAVDLIARLFQNLQMEVNARLDIEIFTH